MDSLTQFALGAVVGEAVLGRKLGNTAILLGGLAGTIPDLDVFVADFFDPVVAMKVHRGFSHSIFFAMIFGPVLGGLAHLIYKKISLSRWCSMFFLTLLTHTLLDCCTTYGTQLFSPLTDYLVSFNNIFVVDPLYTFPLVLSLLIGLFISRHQPARQWVNRAGIALSCLYLLWSFTAHQIAHHKFDKALKAQGITYEKVKVTPSLFNTLLWHGIVKTQEGYYFAEYSVFDRRKEIPFRFANHNKELLKPYRDAPEVKVALWFAQGFYVLKQVGNQVHFHTVKFGPANLEGPVEFIFPLIIEEVAGKVKFTNTYDGPDGAKMIEFFKKLWVRIMGY